MMNGRDLFRYMRCLARSHPHLAVALVYDQGGLRIGLMNIIPTSDDWYYPPVPVKDLETPVLKDGAWGAKILRRTKNAVTGDVAQR